MATAMALGEGAGTAAAPMAATPSPCTMHSPQGDATPGYSDLCALDSGKTVGLLHCHEGRVLFTRIPAPEI